MIPPSRWPGTFDDAGVYRLTSEIALIQTVTFLPLSLMTPLIRTDCSGKCAERCLRYGWTPLMAMNHCLFPVKEMDKEILKQMLLAVLKRSMKQGRSGRGHSVEDKEIKYGLAVSGIVHR